jgi:membrane-bound serine protease (ClpP class)
MVTLTSFADPADPIAAPPVPATAPAAPLAPAPAALPAVPGPEAAALQPIHEKAALIRLSGNVDDMMRKSLERRIDVARKAGCTLIILQVDTYGGLVTSAMEISKIIKRLPGENIRTAAWVNNKAYSAGSLISVACQQIVMVNTGTIGDCAPIRVDDSHRLIPLPADERAKITSPILEEFKDSADRNGFDKAMLRAMVVAADEIHEVRNATTGETKFVDSESKTRLLAEEVAAPGGGKERPWKFVQTVDDANQLLTVGAPNALRMGISKATVNNEQELRAALNIRGDLHQLDFSWGEVVATEVSDWLNSPWVRFMLFVTMIVLAVMEFSHPGASLPGIGAIVCLVLLVGAPYITGLAQAWEIVLIVLGVAIIAADLFFFGGIGFLAIPGFILMAVGLIAAFIPMEPGRLIPTLPGTADAVWRGLAIIVFGSLVAMGIFAFLSRYLYTTPGFKHLQLAPSGVTSDGPTIKDAADRPANEAVFVGAMGRATTDLRPAGKVRFDEHLVDVVSYGSFIPQGTEIEVVSVEGYRVVVRPRQHNTETSSGGTA